MGPLAWPHASVHTRRTRRTRPLDHVFMARILVSGNDQEREQELRAINTIGRHPDNTLQILDRIVSKEHAQIIRQPDGRFLFRDLGSLNGSFYKGERLTDRVLEEGDEII